MREKEDYLDQEKTDFQHCIDSCAQDWLALWGEAGVTNYAHVLASGYNTDHVINFCCLRRLTPQGWEDFNSALKSFFLEGQAI